MLDKGVTADYLGVDGWGPVSTPLATVKTTGFPATHVLHPHWDEGGGNETIHEADEQLVER